MFKKHTHTHTQPFYGLWILFRTACVSRYQKKHSPTHTCRGHLLPPSVMIYGILPAQFTCLTVFFHNLSPSFLWSTCWPGTLNFILHTFLHPIIVFFSQHMPIPSQHQSTEGNQSKSPIVISIVFVTWASGSVFCGNWPGYVVFAEAGQPDDRTSSTRSWTTTDESAVSRKYQCFAVYIIHYWFSRIALSVRFTHMLE